MNGEHDKRFDGLFGEEGAKRSGARRDRGNVPLAGIFGARGNPFKQSDRKSPAEKPTPPEIDDGED